MFPSLVLGKVFGSPVHYWEIHLDFPVHAVLGKGSISSPVQYLVKVVMFSSPTLEKGSRFPCPLLGKGSLHSPVQYWEKVLSNTGKMFYRFPSPILGKGCIGSPIQYLVKVIMFSSPTLEKGSRFPSPLLGKGSIHSPVQYWEKVLGSPVQYWEKVL